MDKLSEVFDQLISKRTTMDQVQRNFVATVIRGYRKEYWVARKSNLDIGFVNRAIGRYDGFKVALKILKGVKR